MRSLVVIGTRPEAIKLAPVVKALKREECSVHVCVSGQHTDLLDSVIGFFGIFLTIFVFGLILRHIITKHHKSKDPTRIKGNFSGEEFPTQNFSKDGPRPLPPQVPPGQIDTNLLPDPVKLERLADWLDTKDWKEYNGSSQLPSSQMQENLRTWAEYLRTIK